MAHFPLRLTKPASTDGERAADPPWPEPLQKALRGLEHAAGPGYVLPERNHTRILGHRVTERP